MDFPLISTPAKGEKIVVLLFGNDLEISDLEKVCPMVSDSAVEFKKEHTVVGMAGSIVTDNADLYLISSSDTHYADLIAEIEDTSARAQTCILVPEDDQDLGNVYDQDFGFIKLYFGDALKFQLPIVIANAKNSRIAEKEFRRDKNDLIKQLLDHRDEQERVQDQAIKIVEMAEGLEYSKRTLERLNKEKDHLFSIIAHDLKSPFTSILSYSYLLMTSAEKLDVDQIKDYANTTHQAATNVFKLMQTLLEWARLQIRNVDYAPQWCRVNDIIQPTAEVYANIAQQKEISIQVNSNELLAYCDQGMAETVVRNLINNAIKFTHKGGTVEILATDAENYIEISVRDNGTGMNDEQRQACFHINAGLRTQGTNGETGSGLGLAICKDMVEKNGGSLKVKTQLNQGSTFTFTLPKEETRLH